MKLAKIKKTYLVAAAALGVGAMICLPRFASASVQGACNVCHTMHNSQNGVPMTFNGSATPNDTLLRGNCLTCHTGTNDGSNVRPYVDSTVAPTYGLKGNTLAGGNFYWCVNGGSGALFSSSTSTNTVVNNDPVAIGGGHNVNFLGVAADVLTSPPGYSDSIPWTTREATEGLASTSHLTCAGAAGCHGNRTDSTAADPVNDTNNFSAVHGAHHANDSIIDGSTVGKSFRFLLGVLGTEEDDAPGTSSHRWEYQPDSTHHNEYYGVGRTANDDDVTGTISHLCAECHGAFHNDSGTYTGVQGIQGSGATMASPWIRHPTDFDMNGLGGEYAAYTVYNPMVPVGHSTLEDVTNDSVAYGNANGAIVMCISCHRAHGSPFADLLRWDYTTMVAGGGAPSGSLGCFTCHSTKD